MRDARLLPVVLTVLLAAGGFLSRPGPRDLATAGPVAAVATDREDAGQLDLRRLDLRRLAIPGRQGPGPDGPLQITITTWGIWDRRLLAETASHRLQVLFDTTGDGKANYTGRVLWHTSGYALSISGSGSNLEPIEVRRPTTTTLTMVIPGSSPPNPSDRRPGIAVQSTYLRPGTACDPQCTDRIPDTGWLKAP